MVERNRFSRVECRRPKKKVSLDLLILILEDLMADMNALQEKIAQLVADAAATNVKLDTTSQKVTDGFNRLEQKIAAGSDTQAAIDALAPVAQSLSDMNQKLESLGAQADVSGI